MRQADFRDFSSSREFMASARCLASSVVAASASLIDATDELPPDLVKTLAMHRLLALDRLSDDGPKLDFQKKCQLILQVVQELAYTSAAVAKMVLDQNLGQTMMFQDYAAKEIVEFYLQKIRTGEIAMAFLMTEPQTGSDVRRIVCSAQPAPGGFLLRGEKDWITGARERPLWLVVARSSESSECGLFLVDRTSPEAMGATSIEDRKEKLGLRGLGEHRVTFHDTFVPMSQVVLRPERGSVAKIMKHYNLKRCGQAYIAIGLSKAALNVSYKYLRERHPGIHGELAFQTAQFRFAELASQVQAAEALNEWAVRSTLDGDSTGTPASMAKLIATKAAIEVTNEAVQFCGAAGLSRGLPLERYLRDARMLTVAGGTSEILKLTIGRNLPHLLREPCDPQEIDPRS